MIANDIEIGRSTASYIISVLTDGKISGKINRVVSGSNILSATMCETDGEITIDCTDEKLRIKHEDNIVEMDIYLLTIDDVGKYINFSLFKMTFYEHIDRIIDRLAIYIKTCDKIYPLLGGHKNCVVKCADKYDDHEYNAVYKIHVDPLYSVKYSVDMAKFVICNCYVAAQNKNGDWTLFFDYDDIFDDSVGKLAEYNKMESNTVTEFVAAIQNQPNIIKN
ncbi:MAG: hypothetical protein Faunusvirus5_3 [Faunusvirus sp.]|jgi:hypothetical protein|uniref:Uncharacterized protein n=1 Tax=Faunusvirus sp. TaxID=2487766 RepID=A0A3G4ZY01_9VIRU|nr:MAG: hypothetical protein Faunusvirus5_3 [Faunusvirus sp.]